MSTNPQLPKLFVQMSNYLLLVPLESPKAGISFQKIFIKNVPPVQEILFFPTLYYEFSSVRVLFRSSSTVKDCVWGVYLSFGNYRYLSVNCFASRGVFKYFYHLRPFIWNLVTFRIYVFVKGVLCNFRKLRKTALYNTVGFTLAKQYVCNMPHNNTIFLTKLNCDS